MSFKTCCVENCFVSCGHGVPLHRFPNPSTDQERFQAWVRKIGGQVATLEQSFVFKNRRICHKHFDPIYYGSKNRLSKIAVPSIISEPDNMNVEVRISDGPSEMVHPHNQLQESLVQCVTNTSEDCNVPMSTQKESALPKNVIPMPTTSSRHSDNMNVEVPISDGPSAHPHNQPQESLVQCVTNTSEDCNVPMSTQKESALPKNVIPMPTTSSRHSGKMTKNKLNLTRIIRALKRQVHKNKVANKSFRQRLNLANKNAKEIAVQYINKNLTKSARTFIKMQLKQAGKKSKGRRFTLQEKVLSLSLYKSSPKAYRLFSEICILPKRTTLLKLLQEVKLQPGINRLMFENLKKRVNRLPVHHRYCTVIFDEMSINPNLTYDKKMDEIIGFSDNDENQNKEFCNHVLVFMVRGVVKKYKQPVAYVFRSSKSKSCELIKMIKLVIQNVQETGLKVIATVCDQGTTNMSAIKILLDQTRELYLKKGIEWKSRFFEINSKKIVPIFDPPHLIKGVRNNLLTKKLKYTHKNKECTAQWQHIMDLYKRSPGYSGYRLVPKLTAHHVLPNFIPKMRVKHCTQVFSRSVGVAMGFMADSGKLPEESKQTADLLILFDNLFDSVNGSSTKIEGGKIYRCAVTPNSPHHKLWRESLPILRSMKFVLNNGRETVVPSISSWIKTIEGFEIILKDLNKNGITSILLRHFNQDPLENFFGAIRSQGCHNVMPNASQFQSSYKTLLVNNLTSAHSVGANCEKDTNSCLLDNLEDFFLNTSENSNSEGQITTLLEEHLTINFINIENLIMSQSSIDVERCAALGYCSGWLIKKAKNIYKTCPDCKKNLESDKIENFHKFIKISEFSDKTWLTYSTREAFDFFVQCENITKQILLTHCTKKNLCEYIKLVCLININLSFINCNLHKAEVLNFLLAKSVIFNLYTWCKIINKILSGKEINWDHNDPMQAAAYQYYEKNKTQKKTRK